MQARFLRVGISTNPYSANMLHEAKAFIKYQVKAKGAQSIRSPFLKELYQEIILGDPYYYDYDRIESLRASLLREEREIAITDFGAGSRVFKSNVRKLKDVAKHCLGSPKEGHLLFRSINHLKPQTILELGTSLGVNTLYQSLPNKQASVITFEGCPETAKIAQENFKKFSISPKVVVGNLDEALGEEVEGLSQIDFAFFDANHQYEPTVQYFQTCLEKAGENSLFIFDDIHWSEGMEKAWEEIKAHPSVSLSIDIFHLGLVFFKKAVEEEHCVLKF